MWMVELISQFVNKLIWIFSLLPRSLMFPWNIDVLFELNRVFIVYYKKY